MRRLQEMLNEANGPDSQAKLEKVRANRDEAPGHYTDVLREQLGTVASDSLVVKPEKAREAREDARAITDEHPILDTDKLVKH